LHLLAKSSVSLSLMRLRAGLYLPLLPAYRFSHLDSAQAYR
jgi:hypothetical protein